MVADQAVKKADNKGILNNRDRAAVLAEMLKAIAHPLRLSLLALLRDGERTVSDMARELETPQAVVSQQLRILRMAGLVSADRRDGFAHYSLSEPRVVDLLACMEGCER
jgi:DNA-binding transcriptional ArsR family regulator